VSPRSRIPRYSSVFAGFSLLFLAGGTVTAGSLEGRIPEPVASEGPGIGAWTGVLPAPPSHPALDAQPLPAPNNRAGLRTNRLPAGQLGRWQAIETLVFTEDEAGRPRYPTLRAMWEEVVASPHEVYVELPEPGGPGCCIAGLFRVESIGPDGRVVALVRLDLETIDRSTEGHAGPDGLRRFQGLDRLERYAEVLGHELGHAVFTLADPSRPRESLELRSRTAELARALRSATPDEGAQIRQELGALGAQAEALEKPARAAEAQVWRELAGRLKTTEHATNLSSTLD